MTSSRQLSKLFSAISDRDWDRVEVAASEICRQQEDRGHFGTAKALRGSLRSNSTTTVSSPFPLSAVTGNDQGTTFLNSLRRITGETRLSDVQLRRDVRQSFDELLVEFKYRSELEKAGLGTRQTLLLHGPPGVGKSMTALALGNELQLPVFLVRFDAIIGAYLGQTAVQLRQLFQFAESTPSVLLIDEIDALGKQRGNPLDVGELDRVVIALMQELEHARPKGFVIATSNVPKQLDQALWRRFEFVIGFVAPNKSELIAFGRELAKHHNIRFTQKIESAVITCKNYSDAKGVILNHARKVLIQQIEEADGQVASNR